MSGTIEVKPRGAQGYSVELLRASVAASAKFQAQRGVEEEREALTYVLTPWLRDPEADGGVQRARPFARIELDEFSRGKDSTGTRYHFDSAGALLLTLTDVDRNPDDAGAAELSFLNFCDGVIDDLLAEAGEPSRLPITQIEQVQKPVHSPEDEEDQYWWAKFRVRWSLFG